MASQIKIRATFENGVTTVKTLMIHPMETGLFKDKTTGEPIPAHFIKEVKCEHNGSIVLNAEYGIAVSKNPYMAFSFDGGALGDMITVSWVDNRGASDSAETTIT